MNWRTTKFTAQFGLDLPIVQGPFGGGISSVDLTSTVSNQGALGSFGGQPYSAMEIIETCRAIRKQTNKPFNINLWVMDRDPHLNQYTTTQYEKLTSLFKPYFDEMRLPVPPMPTHFANTFDEQIEAIFEAKPAVFSFVYGIPSAQVLEKCKRLGIKTLGTATTVDEAIALEAAGIDAIVATGFEAGGHRVSFLNSAEESLTGTMALVPQVVDSVKIPVVAAGGIADARGIKAAFALGAHAVQMGTAFLATRQSNASPEHKEKLFSPEARYTTLTKIFTGRLSRAIKNRLTTDLKKHESEMAPYPLQSQFMSALKVYPATSPTNSALKAFWAGQSAALLKYKDANQLLDSLKAEMDKQL